MTKQAKIMGGIVLVLFTIGLIINPIVVIGAGERGVVFNNATGVKQEALGEGMHLRTPFIESVKKVNVQIHATSMDLITGSKDNNQTVTYKVTTNWHINPENVSQFYQQQTDTNESVIGDKMIVPALQQAVKSAQAQFNADESIARQAEIRTLAENIARPTLVQYNILLDSIVIEDQDFTAQYNKALEDRAQARIEADQAVFLKQKAQNESDARLVTASASARVAILEAQGKAEAQRLTQLSLTPELLQQQAIQKWDGHYPTTTLGSSVPLIQLGGN